MRDIKIDQSSQVLLQAKDLIPILANDKKTVVDVIKSGILNLTYGSNSCFRSVYPFPSTPPVQVDIPSYTTVFGTPILPLISSDSSFTSNSSKPGKDNNFNLTLQYSSKGILKNLPSFKISNTSVYSGTVDIPFAVYNDSNLGVIYHPVRIVLSYIDENNQNVIGSVNTILDKIRNPSSNNILKVFANFFSSPTPNLKYFLCATLLDYYSQKPTGTTGADLGNFIGNVAFYFGKTPNPAVVKPANYLKDNGTVITLITNPALIAGTFQPK